MTAKHHFVVAKLALVLLYAAYVTLYGAPVVVAVAVVIAVVAAALASAEDDVGVRGACAAGSVVLAVLHARVVDLGAADAGLQQGLVTAVLGSASATLLLQRARRRRVAPAVVVGLVLIVAFGVKATVFNGGDGWSAALCALAFVRPLGAVGAALGHAGLHDGGRDPGLWWRAEVSDVEVLG